MGLYGAIIVLPSRDSRRLHVRAATPNLAARTATGAKLISGWRAAAYNHPKACYDREYLFQFSEMDPRIHRQALDQVTAAQAARWRPGCSLKVATEPYVPAYFMINGRSMPDDMDTNYAPQYPHQPYNGNPAHASGRAGAAAHHRPGPVAASVPRARQPCAHPGARREPDSQPDQSATISPDRCCSPPRRLRDRPWTGSSTGPARA